MRSDGLTILKLVDQIGNLPVAPTVSSNADTVVQPKSANNQMAGCSTSWSSV